MLTHGDPRQHIWTFAAGLDEEGPLATNNCVCTIERLSGMAAQPPDFVVKTDYFCDTGAARRLASGVFYGDDPLWDGAGCGPENVCCSFNNPPWFYRELPKATSDDIELRLCHDEPTENEDVAIEIIELYVRL